VAEARAQVINDYYTETLTLLTHDTSTGGYWSTSTGAEYSTDVSLSAAVNLLSGDERYEYGRLGFQARYKCFADVTTEISEGRRCRWNSDTYVIVGVPKNTLQKGHHMRFLLGDVNDA
jgi:hypothetical protein